MWVVYGGYCGSGDRMPKHWPSPPLTTPPPPRPLSPLRPPPAHSASSPPSHSHEASGKIFQLNDTRYNGIHLVPVYHGECWWTLGMFSFSTRMANERAIRILHVQIWPFYFSFPPTNSFFGGGYIWGKTLRFSPVNRLWYILSVRLYCANCQNDFHEISQEKSVWNKL